MNHIFYEIFEKLPRVGPGSIQATTQAFNTLKQKTDLPGRLNVLDIGCGTGIHTVQLAELIQGKINALDAHQKFLDSLVNRIKKEGLSEKIEPVIGDMSAMKFEQGSFDLIWAEGSIFIMGLAKGLKEWKKFLKPGGRIVLSDAFLFGCDSPEELKAFWDQQYPDILTSGRASEVIREEGYKIVDHFPLPESAWWNSFYTHLEEQLTLFRVKYADNPEGMELITALQHEIDIFRKYSNYYGYIFFLLEKI